MLMEIVKSKWEARPKIDNIDRISKLNFIMQKRSLEAKGGGGKGGSKFISH